jgi:hypothetical protein
MSGASDLQKGWMILSESSPMVCIVYQVICGLWTIIWSSLNFYSDAQRMEAISDFILRPKESKA